MTEATTSRIEAITPPWQLFFEKNIERFIGDDLGLASGGIGDGWITTECYDAYVNFCGRYGYGTMSNSNFGINLKKFCDNKQRKRDGQPKRYYYLNERGNDLLQKYHEKLSKMDDDDIEIKHKQCEKDAKIALKITDEPRENASEND